MPPTARRRGWRPGPSGALGGTFALALGVAAGLPVPGLLDPSAPRQAQATPPVPGGDPLAFDHLMVTGPVEDPSLRPRLAERLQLSPGGAPYACITPPAPGAPTTTGPAPGPTGATGPVASTTSSSTTSTTAPGTAAHLRLAGTPTTTSSSTTTPPAGGPTTSTTVPSAATSSSAPITTLSPTSTSTPVVVPGERAGYDLLESNGLVAAFGGAGAYGPKRALAHGAVGEAVTVDGGGYWLLAAGGQVSAFGDAITYGQPRHVAGRAVAIAATPDGGGYWVLTSRGSLDNLGDAVFCGSGVHKHPAGHFVAMAPMPDGDGYFLVASNGAVYPFGGAPALAPSGPAATRLAPAGATGATGGTGATGSVKSGASGASAATGAGRASAAPTIVSIAVTPDGAGYWLLGSNGAVHAYGDARYLGGASAKRGVGTFVGIASTPDGKGYLLGTSLGRVFQYGDAAYAGSFAHRRLAKLRVVAMSMAIVPPPSSTGPTGGSGGSTTTTTTTSTTTTSSSTTTTTRAPATTTSAPQHTGTTLRTTTTTTTVAHHPTSVPTTTAPPVPAVHGSFGYDISDYQCAKPGSSRARASLPSSSHISIVQVAGWMDSAANPCLAAEAAWAQDAAGAGGRPYDLYLFMNSPGTNSVALAQAAKGPGGLCAKLAPAARPSCIAYNYGYNGAVSALAYAARRNVHARRWWLDVENSNLSRDQWSNFGAGEYWSGSTALNDRTIAGAIEALHRAGVIAGIYSTSVQYPRIAGNFVPSGPRVPIWVAGVPWTSPPFTEHGLYRPSTLARWCAGRAGYTGFRGGELFAGGIVRLLQETPGTEPSPYGLDPDYIC